MIYTPFSGSKFEKWTLKFRYFYGLRFEPRLLTLPKAIYFVQLNSFGTYEHHSITLKIFQPILSVLGVNWVFDRPVSSEVPTIREWRMAPHQDPRGVLKTRNFYFSGTQGQTWMNEEEMLKKWGTKLFPASRTSRLKIVLFRSIFSYCRIPILSHLWETKQLRNRCV